MFFMYVILVTSMVSVIAWILPSTRVSAYRMKMWRLRDEAYDRLARPTAQRSALLCDIEDRILIADLVRPSTYVVTLVAALLSHAIPPAPERRFDLPAASASERQIIDQYRDAIARADVVHLLTSSPSGVITAVLACPTLVALRAGRGHRWLREHAGSVVSVIRHGARPVPGRQLPY